MSFNSFVPNVPFPYPLKTSENRKVFWCFRGVEKGCIGNEWFNEIFYQHDFLKMPRQKRKVSDRKTNKSHGSKDTKYIK